MNIYMDQEFLNHILFICTGAGITLQYSVISVIFGIIIGTILAIFKVSDSCILRYLANIYTSIFRGTPLLIQLSIVYFAFPQILGINVSAFVAGIIAFSCNSGAYVSEIVRAGIESVDIGQFEACKTLSISRYNMYQDIIIPQAIRNILPALVNELINMLKESAIVSFIGEYDLMRRAQLVSAEQYSYFYPLLVAALCYYIMVMILTFIAYIVSQRLKI